MRAVAFMTWGGPEVLRIIDMDAVLTYNTGNAMVGSAPFWLLSWSGRGKMPIRNVHGKQYATLWTADVRLPATISTISGPERKYSAFIRSAPLSQVLDFVRRSSVRKRN